MPQRTSAPEGPTVTGAAPKAPPRTSDRRGPTAPQPPPPSDEERRARLDAAKAFGHHLQRGLKRIALYRHDESKREEYLAKACEALGAFTAAYGPLRLQVDIGGFQYLGEEVLADDSPIPYRFFREGIRQIVFRPGFTAQELATFVAVCLSDPERGADELNAQLWRAALPNFEYVMADGFRIAEADEDEVQVQVDEVVSVLHRRLRSNSTDTIRFARVTEDDLDQQLDDIEQIRGVVIQGTTADATLKARVQKEIADDEQQRLFPKLISAVFQVVESGIDDPDLLKELFVQLLDAMLLQEDFATINQVVLKLRAMAKRGEADGPVDRLAHWFVGKMGEEQRLRRVGEILKSRPASPAEITKYLAALGPSSTSLLVDLLEALEAPESRALLCDVLVDYARQLPQVIAERLEAATTHPRLQRDLVYVIDRSNHPDKLKHFAGALKSENLALRLDVMGIIAKGRTAEARRMIHALLADPNPQVRMHAARALPHFGAEAAFADLTQIVRSKGFDDRPREEQEAFCAAIGSTGLAAATELFTQSLRTRSGLFSRQRVLQEKLRALVGLAAAPSAHMAAYLDELATDTAQPHEVRAEATRQALRVRKRLAGEAGETGLPDLEDPG